MVTEAGEQPAGRVLQATLEEKFENVQFFERVGKSR
jgi:hypothetical protein